MKEYNFYSFLNETSVPCIGHRIDFVLWARLGGKIEKSFLFRVVEYFLIIEFPNNFNVSVSYLIFKIAQLKAFCLFSFPNGGE